METTLLLAMQITYMQSRVKSWHMKILKWPEHTLAAADLLGSSRMLADAEQGNLLNKSNYGNRWPKPCTCTVVCLPGSSQPDAGLTLITLHGASSGPPPVGACVAAPSARVKVQRAGDSVPSLCSCSACRATAPGWSGPNASVGASITTRGTPAWYQPMKTPVDLPASLREVLLHDNQLMESPLSC